MAKCYKSIRKKNEREGDAGKFSVSYNMKNIKKILLILSVVALIATGLCACSPIEEEIDTPDLKYDTQYPQTEAEYKLAMNEHVMLYMNCLRTHIASGNHVLNGTYVIANEITAAKNSLADMEEAYQKASRVYPPSDMTQKHASIMLQMQEAVNSLSVYIEYLEKSDGTVSDPTLRADIEATIGIMNAEYTSLSGVFHV